MLSTESKRRLQSTGLTARTVNPTIWTEETLREDAAVIVKLFREGKLSQNDMEIILSLMLSGYILSEADVMTSEIEDAFTQMLIEQIANNR